MENYNYKVVAELREDLSEEERERALTEIEERQRKFKIVKIDGNTFCKAGAITGESDFGSVSFFFFSLEEIKAFFSKLEFYDIGEGEKRIAV